MMKINSAACAIVTPEKLEVVEGSTTPLKITRSSPSSDFQEILFAICRLHRFCHISSDILPLEAIRLTFAMRNRIRKLFVDFNLDLAEWMLALEQSCSETLKYSKFLQTYIHLEFQVLEIYSFAVIILLNYSEVHNLTLEKAFGELFGLSFELTHCSECSEVKLGGQTTVDIREKNLEYIRKVIVNDLIDDNIDTDDDPEFNPTSGTKGGESSSEELSDVGGVTVSKDVSDSRNPFIDSDDTSNDPFKFRDESSEHCNPFLSSASEEESLSESKNIKCQKPPKTSSVKKTMSKYECEHCQKRFSTTYNLTLHIIQIHRIFVEGVKVFKCPESSCSFVTGSKICYNRHATSHLRQASRKQVVKSSPKISCRICGEKLSNPSSLKRHEKRKH